MVREEVDRVIIQTVQVVVLLEDLLRFDDGDVVVLEVAGWRVRFNPPPHVLAFVIRQIWCFQRDLSIYTKSTFASRLWRMIF